MPVVLYHAWSGYIPSGFVGVDIFFVISGYLIGGIIYRESSGGQFSFLRFYARRARRILPALFVVIAFSVGIGLLLLNTQEATLFAGSSQWAILGISNIFFFRHIDYFARSAETNPLLMTWSLGVEEQFYIIFPFVILALRWLRPSYHIAGLSVLNMASLIIAIWLATAYPSAGFYLLPARAWEMGAGAVLAIWHLQVPLARRRWASSDALALTGLAAILVSYWAFDEQTPFPGYAALLPVLGTVALLHTSDSSINRKVLTARLFVGTGLISYSWYLWHWPLMAFVRVSANGAPTFAAMTTAAVVSLGIAILSWRYVEQPFRRVILPQAHILARYGLVVATLVLGLAVFKREDSFAALRLSPQVRQIERLQAMSFAGPACMAQFGEAGLPKGGPCAPPGAGIALLGDSHATHLRFGLLDHAAAHGARVLQLTKAGCPPFLGYSREDKLTPDNLSSCAQFQARAVERIASDPVIRTVVLAAYLDDTAARASYAITRNGFVAVPAEVAALRGIGGMVSVFHKAGKHVVLVLDAPKYDRNVYDDVLTRQMPLRKFIGTLSSLRTTPRTDIAATATMRSSIRRSFERTDGLTILDLKDTFCTSRSCRYASDGLPLYVDDHHLSITGSRQIDWRGVLEDKDVRRKRELEQRAGP